MFMTFGLFNVIVAIFVENVLAAAKTNDQLVKKHRLRDQTYLGNKMVELLMVFWDLYREEENCEVPQRTSGKMSLEELVERAAPMQVSVTVFNKLCRNSKVRDIFRDLDVAEEDQTNLFEALDVDGSGTIDIEELFEGIAKLRGDARRSDIVSMSLQIRNLQWSLQELLAIVQLPAPAAHGPPAPQ
eukprot:CAMPEP_0115282756 /NCGR_PEP_ID=MMETSP0270-20121206/60013_1 /TAXON_ID=71861 /ORGANISM="Scrippsiella trochoidea, Strain CCMP3099" /LENGTH=185 /DNA_ID=CAMNT_0002699625 /DNA_START=69 /DNA_END=626 /DNA_ORIENTATION=+